MHISPSQFSFELSGVGHVAKRNIEQTVVDTVTSFFDKTVKKRPELPIKDLRFHTQAHCEDNDMMFLFGIYKTTPNGYLDEISTKAFGADVATDSKGHIVGVEIPVEYLNAALDEFLMTV